METTVAALKGKNIEQQHYMHKKNLRLGESVATYAQKLQLLGQGRSMGFSLSRGEHRALPPP